MESLYYPYSDFGPIISNCVCCSGSKGLRIFEFQQYLHEILRYRHTNDLAFNISADLDSSRDPIIASDVLSCTKK